MATNRRNQYVDVLRGIAMLMVVLGHTMTGCTQNAENSFVYNVIWSLQMPLFILISGYVTRYSRGVGTARELGRFVLRRTVAYLLPWTVWTFLIRGLLLGHTEQLFDPQQIFWHMDAGYWFLITIWTISMVYAVAQFLTGRLCKTDKRGMKLLLFSLCYACGMGALGAVGLALGLRFFSIKLTLYYMPFFYAGWLYGQLREGILAKQHGKLLADLTIAVCAAAWIAILCRVNLYAVPDGGAGIALRAAASLTGCVAVCGLCRGIFAGPMKTGPGTGAKKLLCSAGRHSMEIYTTHYLLLCIVKLSPTPELLSLRGVGATALNYTLTLALTAAVIALALQSRVLRTVLYGKTR